MNKEIDLSVSCYGKVKDLSYDVAILPWGATEPHNYHLPYLTDCILSHDTSVDAAEKAFRESGVRCMVLPPVTYGSQNPGQRDYPFCLHARYETAGYFGRCGCRFALAGYSENDHSKRTRRKQFQEYDS